MDVQRLCGLARDAVGLGALGAVGYGCWLLHPSLPYIVCGGAVLAMVMWGSWNHNDEPPERADDDI